MGAERFGIYTVNDISKMLQCHRRTVLRYINSGELMAIKVKRQYRITNATWQNFLEKASTEGKKHGQVD